MKSKIGAYLRQKEKRKTLLGGYCRTYRHPGTLFVRFGRRGIQQDSRRCIYPRLFAQLWELSGPGWQPDCRAYRLGLDPKLVMGEEEKVEIPVKPELPRSSDTIVISRDMFPLRKISL